MAFLISSSLLRDVSATVIDVPLENAQNMHSVWTAWFQFWHKQHNLCIDVLFFSSILNEQRIQWVQLDRLKKALKCNEAYLQFHCISCAIDKAAWRTPKIRMQRIAFECGFLFLIRLIIKIIFFDSPSVLIWCIKEFINFNGLANFSV